MIQEIEEYIRSCHFFGDEPDIEDIAKILWGEEWQSRLEN